MAIGVSVVLAVVAAAVFVALLAARPLSTTVVVIASVIVGILAGVGWWSWRTRAKDSPSLRTLMSQRNRTQREARFRPLLLEEASPAPSRAASRRHFGRWVAAGALILLAATAAVVSLAGKQGGHDNGPREPRLPTLTPATYEATLTFDSDGGHWSVHETIDVPLPGRRGHPASLCSGWHYQGPGGGRRIAVYARDRTIPAEFSFWPARRVTNVIDVPQPRLSVRPKRGATGSCRAKTDRRTRGSGPPGSGRAARSAYRVTFIADDKSQMHLRGPRRLIGDTTPAAAKRTKTAGHTETIDLKLTGLRYNADRRHISVDLANGIARSDLYVDAVKYGAYVLGAIITGILGFSVNWVLKRRFGDGTKPAPAPGAA